jgi:hypothetical protein
MLDCLQALGIKRYTLGMSFSRVERRYASNSGHWEIAFEFPIQFPILLGGDVLGVMEFFSFTI